LADVKANAARVHLVPLPSPGNNKRDAEVIFTEVSLKKKNRRRRGKNSSPKAVVVDADSTTPVESSAPTALAPDETVITGAAMYSQVLAGPPPIPRNTPPGMTRVAAVSTPPQRTQATTPPRSMRVPTATPTPNTRERHVTMRFAAGKNVQLPVTLETIRIRLDQALSNMGKVGGSTPYFREARPRLNIGCIFLTLAEHTAAGIWGQLERCRATLLREYGPNGLTDFDFARDVENIKVLVSGVPLAPTGRGSIWKTDDWVGDKAYDGLRNDIEKSNTGVVTAGRPNVSGSIYAMRKNNATSCAIRDTLERNTAVNRVMQLGRVFLFRTERNVRIWEEHRPAQMCGKCLQVGHMQVLCGFPPVVAFVLVIIFLVHICAKNLTARLVLGRHVCIQ